VALGGVQAEPRFREHVFPRLQGRQSNWAMKVRPSAYHDRINVRISHQVLPMFKCLGNAELMGHRSGGSRPAIAHGHDLHVLDGLESGNVTQTGIGARADQTYAENLTCHVYFSP